MSHHVAWRKPYEVCEQTVQYFCVPQSIFLRYYGSSNVILSRPGGVIFGFLRASETDPAGWWKHPR
jgi:hypothetical protein